MNLAKALGNNACMYMHGIILTSCSRACQEHGSHDCKVEDFHVACQRSSIQSFVTDPIFFSEVIFSFCTQFSSQRAPFYRTCAAIPPILNH